jgi:hypothetical protein
VTTKKRLGREKFSRLKLPKRLSRREWDSYCDERAQNLEGLPTVPTAERVWDLLKAQLDAGGFVLEDFLPKDPKDLSAAEREKVTRTAKQALVVVLDLFVIAGARHETFKTEKDQRGGMLTFNHVFDALAGRWSRHFCQLRDQGLAYAARDMLVDTVRASRRDLLGHGIRLDTLWRVAALVKRPKKGQPRTPGWSEKDGQNPLYYVRALENSGCQVTLRNRDDNPLLGEFVYAVHNDPRYRPSDHGWRLFFDELGAVMLPPHRQPPQVCNERPYNEIKLGDRSVQLLNTQQQAKLMFATEAFREDYETAKRHEIVLERCLLHRFNVDSTASAARRQYTAKQLKNLRAKGRQPYPPERTLQVAKVDKKWRPAVWRLLAAYDRARALTAQYWAAYEQVRAKGPIPKLVPIRTGMYRALNRRTQTEHLWPSAVSSDIDKTREHAPDQPYGFRERTSPRFRWFKVEVTAHASLRSVAQTIPWAALPGVDISGSQVQILAALLGCDKLEEWACSREPTFKQRLAAEVWKKHQAPGSFKLSGGTERAKAYRGPNDPRLIAAVKELVLRVLYGSRVQDIVYDQLGEQETFGPGWTIAEDTKIIVVKRRVDGADVSETRTLPDIGRIVAAGTENALAFLRDLPWYAEVDKYLKACRRLVDNAHAKDPYAGVRFKDPYDGAEIRWHPVARTDKRVESDGRSIIVSWPAGNGRRNAVGEIEYPVDRPELQRFVAPCLIHALDAFYASLVVEQLAAWGIKDVVSVYDGWYVPVWVKTEAGIVDGVPVLLRALNTVAEPWLRGLGGIYDLLDEHLGTDQTQLDDGQTYTDWVRLLRRWWERRVVTRRWPTFAVAAVRMMDVSAGPHQIGISVD